MSFVDKEKDTKLPQGHLLLHLPACHGDLQLDPLLGELCYPGGWQELNYEPVFPCHVDCGGAGGQEDVLPAEIPVHHADSPLHVQG